MWHWISSLFYAARCFVWCSSATERKVGAQAAVGATGVRSACCAVCDCNAESACHYQSLRAECV